MSAELDEKGMQAAMQAMCDPSLIAGGVDVTLPAAIRAYLAASPSPSMEMGVVAMPGIWETKYLRPDARVCKADEVQSVLSQAQSALAAMRAERDALSVGVDAQTELAAEWREHCLNAEAQVQRLTEEKEALRKGKADIALTALAADGQAQEAYEKLSAAEARIKALEEVLRPFADAASLYSSDHPHSNMAVRSGFSRNDDPTPFIPVARLRAARSALKENAL